MSPCTICVASENVVMKQYQNNIIYFGKTDYQGNKQIFGQYTKDKAFHSAVIGATGTGKSNYLKTCILQEVELNQGSIVVFDPNGDLVEDLVVNMPHSRKKDVIIIDPSDPNNIYGYNPLSKVNDENKPFIVSEVIEVFRRLYSNSWGDKVENLMRQSLYLILERKGSTLADIPKVLVDQTFREECRRYTNNQHIQQFWSLEFPKYRSNDLLPLLGKLSSFIHHPAVERSIINPKHTINLRHVLNHNKIILVAISKGKLGIDVSSLIGSMLMTSLSLSIYARAHQKNWNRPLCSLYADEFQNFSSNSMIALFAEVRKYNLSITVSTQSLASLRPEIKNSLLSNIGTLIVFRVSYDEARLLSKYLQPTFTPNHLMSLPNHTVCLVMMINGMVSAPFWARTITSREVDEYMRMRGDL